MREVPWQKSSSAGRQAQAGARGRGVGNSVRGEEGIQIQGRALS